MDYLSHNIAVNLSRIRKSKGMSLDVVAEQTGVSKSMLAQIEKGTANPSVGVLGKILSGLRIEFDDLIQTPVLDSYLVHVDDLVPTKEIEGQYRVMTCFPIADNHMVEIYRIEIEPGGIYKSGLVWICDAGNFGCCIAYCMVSISFVILRKKEPALERPFKVKNYKFVGFMAILLSAFMVAMYIIPNSGATLVWQEWIMVGGWSALGIVFCIACKQKYKEKFGILVEVISDEDAVALQSSDEEISAALDAAIDAAIIKILKQRNIQC